jgi:hypothetical protein
MRRTAIHGRIGWAAAEARCRSVAVGVTPLTRRCRANTRTCEQPGQAEEKMAAKVGETGGARFELRFLQEVATDEVRETTQSHASELPSSSEHMGEQHACERHHTTWWLARSETMDGGSVAVRTAGPDEEHPVRRRRATAAQ